MEFKRIVEAAAWVTGIAALVMANVASSFAPGSATLRGRNLEAVWNGIAAILGFGDVPNSPELFCARLLAGTAVVLGATLYSRRSVGSDQVSRPSFKDRLRAESETR